MMVVIVSARMKEEVFASYRDLRIGHIAGYQTHLSLVMVVAEEVNTILLNAVGMVWIAFSSIRK